MLQQRFPHHLVKVWKTFANYIASTIPGKLRERCHNVERKLWKCFRHTLLQRNPGTLLEC